MDNVVKVKIDVLLNWDFENLCSTKPPILNNESNYIDIDSFRQ